MTTTNGAATGKKSKAKKPSRKAVHIAAPKMKSRRKARQITTEFHRLTSELDAVKKDNTINRDEKTRRIAELNAQIDAIGGRSAYQDASILSTSFHKTSKWVFQLLTKMERRPKSKEAPLRTLEVGAINTQLLSCPWLNVRAIDLNSKHEKIEQCDFFSLVPAGEYDVLVSSMVINCVPDAPSRGKMLQLSFQHLRPGGLFFLMLPLLCLRNSMYMTYSRSDDPKKLKKRNSFSVIL
ncbi:hypothetical protein ATCC90586_000508 [Pythium insidiosum]|nr:hypothetical protein ATCC90586_000508 [Pythium insidiosum]